MRVVPFRYICCSAVRWVTPFWSVLNSVWSWYSGSLPVVILAAWFCLCTLLAGFYAIYLVILCFIVIFLTLPYHKNSLWSKRVLMPLWSHFSFWMQLSWAPAVVRTCRYIDLYSMKGSEYVHLYVCNLTLPHHQIMRGRYTVWWAR